MGTIEFDRVSFAYPTRPHQTVLKNFSLRIPAGRVVALVGASGGGKSTVAQLVERFYDVDGGAIRIDGSDIRSLDPAWLRGRVVGFINQEPVLFATSIMENIRYGRPDASDNEVREAAKMANAHEFVEAFPRGYNTTVGERGVTVSGGQKQRIAIARALLKNPKILILDEATSALDAESEAIVQAALEQCIQGRTVLIIAHRLSTIQNADVIAVMSHGRLAEVVNELDKHWIRDIQFGSVHMLNQAASYVVVITVHRFLDGFHKCVIHFKPLTLMDIPSDRSSTILRKRCSCHRRLCGLDHK
ncbi:ATP-binding cassette, sub-B (MDR TAP), member 8 [Halocaridina rubra]|uniref:Mitochondrial potassium channel ATP-binding subunit n=1 Tax=Halocaridina rubra TaxID=373956 RepID=A0AAN8WTC1_HALRR